MKWRSWLIVAVVALGLIAVLVTVKYSQIRSAITFAQSFPEPSETVRAASVLAVEWQRSEITPGEIVATQTVEVKSELPGTIASINFQAGAEVDAGQVLLTLDSREEVARLDALRARAKLARLTLERNESLASTSAVSRQAADSARAELDSALAEARGVQVIIDKKTMRAPFAGKTTLHEWQVGQFIAQGTTVTWVVGKNDHVWIDFSLPQDVALGVLDDTVEIAIPRLGFSAGATIIAREPYVEQRSRNVGFRAKLDDPDNLLTPGTIVDVVVSAGASAEVLAVPATGLRRDAFGDHVFVLNESEAGADAPYRAARREVELLEIRNDVAYLRTGLSADTLVAADGAFKLRDRILVHVSPGSEDSAAPQ